MKSNQARCTQALQDAKFNNRIRLYFAHEQCKHQVIGIVAYVVHVAFSDIPVTETQTDTEMIDFSKTHTETNTEKIFNTDTVYI